MKLTNYVHRLSKPNYDEQSTHALPQDTVLKELLMTNSKIIFKYHEHDSLLENKIEEELTEAEKQEAWTEFRNEQAKLVVQEKTPNADANDQANPSPSNSLEEGNMLGALDSMLSEPLDLSPMTSLTTPGPSTSEVPQLLTEASKRKTNDFLGGYLTSAKKFKEI